MKTTLFIRHRNKSGHSIEELFYKLSSDMLETRIVELPYPTNSILNIIRNLYFVYKNQSSVNHITGDCHYIALALSNINYNILTVHDCVILSRLTKWNPKFWIFKLFWYNLPIKRVDMITVISEKTKQELLNYVSCNPNKIKLIPNFVNPLFQYTPKLFSKNNPIILQIGTTNNKNIERVVLALQQIRCRLVIIGVLSQSQIDFLKEHKPNFENYSCLSQHELITKYQEADIITFVSTYEGFGMPIIEAQAVGSAIITSNISPMKDIAGEYACLINPYNIEEIGSALCRLIEDDKYRNTLIEQGLENVKKYDFQEIKTQYENCYKLK